MGRHVVSIGVLLTRFIPDLKFCVEYGYVLRLRGHTCWSVIPIESTYLILPKLSNYLMAFPKKIWKTGNFGASDCQWQIQWSHGEKLPVAILVLVYLTYHPTTGSLFGDHTMMVIIHNGPQITKSTIYGSQASRILVFLGTDNRCLIRGLSSTNHPDTPLVDLPTCTVRHLPKRHSCADITVFYCFFRVIHDVGRITILKLQQLFVCSQI